VCNANPEALPTKFPHDEWTMNIIKEDEKKKEPKNTSLRNSSVNWIWFSKHTMKSTDLLAKE